MDEYAFPFSPNRHGGMTLRDYFAAKALEALISNYGFEHPFPSPGATNPWPDFATWAYDAADAMLARRSKETTP